MASAHLKGYAKTAISKLEIMAGLSQTSMLKWSCLCNPCHLIPELTHILVCRMHRCMLSRAARPCQCAKPLNGHYVKQGMCKGRQQVITCLMTSACKCLCHVMASCQAYAIVTTLCLATNSYATKIKTRDP